MTIHNIDFSDSYSPGKYRPKREQIIFQIKEIPHIVFGLWVSEFQTNQYLSHRNRTIFGEFDFVVDKFRPSSVSWSPGYEFVQKGTWVPDGEFIAQITQIKTFVDEPWKLADNSYFPHSKRLSILFRIGKEKRKRRTVLNFANEYITQYMQDEGIAFALVEAGSQ